MNYGKLNRSRGNQSPSVAISHRQLGARQAAAGTNVPGLKGQSSVFGADAGTQHRIVLIPRLRPTPPNVRDVGVPLRVLVVDDEDLVRQELASLIRVMWFGLRSGAIEVRTAATPDEALREIQCDGADVVVLDVDLAGADGLALLPQMLPVARVLVWSGQCGDATRKRALALGADAFVDKGEPAQVLMAHLARLALPAV